METSPYIGEVKETGEDAESSFFEDSMVMHGSTEAKWTSGQATLIPNVRKAVAPKVAKPVSKAIEVEE